MARRCFRRSHTKLDADTAQGVDQLHCKRDAKSTSITQAESQSQHTSQNGHNRKRNADDHPSCSFCTRLENSDFVSGWRTPATTFTPETSASHRRRGQEGGPQPCPTPSDYHLKLGSLSSTSTTPQPREKKRSSITREGESTRKGSTVARTNSFGGPDCGHPCASDHREVGKLL